MREPTSHAHSPAGTPDELRRPARGKAATATASTADGERSAERQAGDTRPTGAAQPMLAFAELPRQDGDRLLALVRAMARDAARTDHAAAEGGGCD